MGKAAIILIDGPNASGKSTLAKSIIACTRNGKYIHCGYKFKDRMFTYHLAAIRRAIRYAEQGFTTVIDRNWLSEEIYAHVYRHGTTWPMEGRILQKLILKHAIQTVTCLLSREDSERLVAIHRTGKYHTPALISKVGDVAERYDEYVYGRPKVMVDADKMTYAQWVIQSGGAKAMKMPLHSVYNVARQGEAVDDYADLILAKHSEDSQNQYDAAMDFGSRNIAGYYPTAKYCLVGDSVNAKDFTRCWPFMEHRRSSLFLHEMLQRVSAMEHELMWTNANCNECHFDLLREGTMKVIALGKAAAQALKYVGIAPHAVVMHPSYALRFGLKNEYSDELSSALYD